jgi:hypothetical protein
MQNRRRILAFLLGATALAAAPEVLAQNPFFLFGRVTWPGGSPAIGIEVSLRYDGETVAVTYTDGTGYYTFYPPDNDAPQEPGAYLLLFERPGRSSQEQAVPSGLQPGNEMPPVTLF